MSPTVITNNRADSCCHRLTAGQCFELAERLADVLCQLAVIGVVAPALEGDLQDYYSCLSGQTRGRALPQEVSCHPRMRIVKNPAVALHRVHANRHIGSAINRPLPCRFSASLVGGQV